MGKTKSGMILVMTVACCSIAYAFGTGWIRVGDVKSPVQVNGDPESGRPNDHAEAGPRNDGKGRPLALHDPAFQLAAIRDTNAGGTTPANAASNVVSRTAADVAAAAAAAAAAADAKLPADTKDALPKLQFIETVKISLTDAGTNAEVKPASDGTIQFHGPTLTLTVNVMPPDDNKNPDLWSNTSFAVNVTKDDRLTLSDFTKPLTLKDRKTPEFARFEGDIKESGIYTIEVIKTRGDEPVSFKQRLEIKPGKSTNPKILFLRQAIGADPDDPRTNPIELKAERFTLIVTADQKGRDLILVDEDASKPATTKDGATFTKQITTPLIGDEMVVNIPPGLITDKLMRLAVYDVWTHERSDVITVVLPSNPTIPPAGSAPRTGPNVEFPEFTAPRSLPNGFNPSDNVQTRVVRLYYYRNAHRVAQIVNRDVQSYNYVAVDTRRRQAESARRDADNRADERARQDVTAVRAAQASRAVEREVRDAQQKLDAATNLATQAAQTTTRLQEVKDAMKATQVNIDALNTTIKGPPILDAAALIDLNQQLDAEKSNLKAELDAQTSLNTIKANQTVAMSKIDPTVTATAVQTAQANLILAQKNLETARRVETDKSDDQLKDVQMEDRARENQFRQEVAAAATDPDTYAPGKPLSSDPVRQVSVSVIGEGEIQLRGPIKGINVIRTMINQIDAPVAQVRVDIHTVQINGEHGDRMEKVAGRIQDYVDHSRFLTSQSGQMLRNAVVTVASRKAVESQAWCEGELNGQLALCPDDPARQELIRRKFQSQEFRDQKYIRSFFGDDFIDELTDIDSEFLHTGNKLLSLHSMDTTSLASALFLIALAKNETRMQILEEFQGMLVGELPGAEANYFAAGGATRSKDHRKFKMLASNAKFQSFMGFFNVRVEGNETLNPLQREFIKLAQIFKSRLVTELELNQRIKERGIIEERLGDYLGELRQQKSQEQNAVNQLKIARQKASEQYRKVFSSVEDLSKWTADINSLNAPTPVNPISPNELAAGMRNEKSVNQGPIEARIGSIGYVLRYVSEANHPVEITTKAEDASSLRDELSSNLMKKIAFLNKRGLNTDPNQVDLLLRLKSAAESINKMQPDPGPKGTVIFRPTTKDLNAQAEASDLATATLEKLKYQYQRNSEMLRSLQEQLLTFSQSKFRESDRGILELIAMLNKLSGFQVDPKSGGAGQKAQPAGTGPPTQSTEISAARDGLVKMMEQLLILRDARSERDESRHPLDHKKFLDMLIDDVEEKYIELIEGTRAHTSNIDAYIKTIATALDDDFNTQYYYPAFTEIRRASRYHDVSLGKIESTNVLTNNRGFGKVEPQATMEFDLPKRDILINEAMNGALAMTKDFGALANDPTFLSMAKLRSGQPTSSLAPGAGAGVNSVRSVVPGLPTSGDEKLFSQQGAGNAQFGSAMEALIPDPAVYSFQTGTGFEIRPVIQPDGQSVVFHFNYLYTTNVREPVRADEKHLGRVKRHFIDTDVQLGNYELREVSRYQVALKASRTSRGVPLFEDIPGLGILFRPLPSAESSLQENIVLAHGTVFPTLFDLMGLRWAPAVADLDTLRLKNQNFVVRGRAHDMANHVFDISSTRVDEFLRVPAAERRPDLYRTQETIPDVHPDGYRGPGLNLRDSHLREGYDPTVTTPESRFTPSDSRDVSPSERLDSAPSVPGAGGSMGSLRNSGRSAPAIAIRPAPANRATPRSAIREPLPSPRGGPAPARAIQPNPAPARDEVIPPLDQPTTSTSTRRSFLKLPGRTTPAVEGQAADGSLVRAAASSLPRLPSTPTADRDGPSVKPKVTRSSPATVAPRDAAPPKPMATPKKATTETPAKPARRSILSRIRGTDE